MRILIIEDEELIRDACEKMLSVAGHEVSTSLNIDEIREKIAQVDLVLSDFNMGLVFADIQDATRKAGIPLILMSGNPAATDLHPNFLSKPFRFPALAALIKRVSLIGPPTA